MALAFETGRAGRRCIGLALGLGLCAFAGMAMAQEVELPPIVVSPSPGQGSTINLDKVPGSVQTLTAQDFERDRQYTPLDSLARQTPGVSLSDVQGSSVAQDLRYRGFTASPLQGTPQGLAVYQNGVRLNEAFGDTVNWDLIPLVAVNRLDIFGNNPVFGLNALGGAVNIEMKNGFTWQGFETQALGGSYGRFSGSMQYGMQKDAFSLYVAADALRDKGWRYESPTRIERAYADLGYRVPGAEFHLIGSGARSLLGVIGPTPVDLIALDERAIYTWPQTTRNQLATVQATGKVDVGSAWTLSGNLYVRRFKQKHVDGNASEFEQCSGDASAQFQDKLCLGREGFSEPPGAPAAFFDQFALIGPNGQPIPCPATGCDGVPYGTVDRTQTQTTTVGGSLQATNKDRLFGLDNKFVVGGSLDRSNINFQSSSQLAAIFPNLYAGTNPDIPGTDIVGLRTFGNLGFAPVNLDAVNTYYGIYALDTLDVTPRLSLTLGARLNVARTTTRDASGTAPELDSSHTFHRLNPLIGATFKVMPNVTAYGSYAESNRAPTTLELNCSDKFRPCLLENSLVPDPPLKQVVSRTYEAGLRGSIPSDGGRFDWKAGVFRTDNRDDIIALASVLQGRGFFTNVPLTRRQGVEAGIRYKSELFSLYANYAFVDATFRFAGELASPNNPAANDDGNILVRPGDRLPAIPRHQLKLGGDYYIMPKWTVGADVSVFTNQFLVGDEANQNAKLPSYWVMNLHTSYQVTDNVQIFGIVNNVFDRRYASFGTFFETDGVANAIPIALTDPRAFTLAPPLSVYGGVKVKF
jgi:iron complex outermembrane recepter protein